MKECTRAPCWCGFQEQPVSIVSHIRNKALRLDLDPARTVRRRRVGELVERVAVGSRLSSLVLPREFERFTVGAGARVANRACAGRGESGDSARGACCRGGCGRAVSELMMELRHVETHRFSSSFRQTCDERTAMQTSEFEAFHPSIVLKPYCEVRLNERGDAEGQSSILAARDLE